MKDAAVETMVTAEQQTMFLELAGQTLEDGTR
jgi:hypothetical protein